MNIKKIIKKIIKFVHILDGSNTNDYIEEMMRCELQIRQEYDKKGKSK